MIVVPSRRWLVVAAALAVIAPLAAWRPGAGLWLLAADACWLVLLVIDAARTPDPRDVQVTREPPMAFAVGRTRQ